MVRAADRKGQYKPGVDSVASRRRRDETTTQIRKNKKNEQLSKRRATAVGDNSDATFGQGLKKPQEDSKLPTLADVPGLVRVMNDQSTPRNQRLNATRSVRRLLSIENPPAREIVQAGVLPILVRFLSFDDDNMLQFEATWALTNVASTDLTLEVVNAGAMPGLVRLLNQCLQADVREQAAWCLGNIAGDSPPLRDMVLRSGALYALYYNVDKCENKSVLQNSVWTLSNLCRGKPSPEFSTLKDAAACMVFVLKHPMLTTESQTDALWALSYLSDGDDVRIQNVVDAKCIPIVMKVLESGKSSVVTPALRILGNIVAGNAEQTQAVIDAGILELVLPLLQHAKRNVRKETAWLLSNIAAGTQEQISTLFQVFAIVQTLVDMSTSAVWEVRKEAIFAVANMFLSKNPKEIATLVDLDADEAMVMVLDLTDTKLVLYALDAIENMLKVSSERNRNYDRFFEEYGGIDKLERLQEHADDRVYKKVVKIIETFFGVEEDHSDENLRPQTQDGFFEFGMEMPDPSSSSFPSSSFPSPSNPSKVLFGESTSSSPSPHAKFNFGFGGQGASNMHD